MRRSQPAGRLGERLWPRSVKLPGLRRGDQRPRLPRPPIPCQLRLCSRTQTVDPAFRPRLSCKSRCLFAAFRCVRQAISGVLWPSNANSLPSDDMLEFSRRLRAVHTATVLTLYSHSLCSLIPLKTQRHEIVYDIVIRFKPIWGKDTTNNIFYSFFPPPATGCWSSQYFLEDAERWHRDLREKK